MPALCSASLLEERFALAMKDIGFFESNPSIAVAVSGGSDSMALTYLLAKWVTLHQGTVIALTFDHGLRPESTQEAKMVGNWLSSEGIEHKILTWERADTSPGNLQETARKARYHALTGWCRDANILHLLTAHHLDDQAETLWMRLEKGAGLYGLASIPQIQFLNHVRIIRPLLKVAKNELMQWLKHSQKLWVEDPTNQKPCYHRNVVRSHLNAYLPNSAVPSLKHRLSDVASHLGRARSAFEKIMANTALPGITWYHDAGYILLDCNLLEACPEEEQLRLLGNLLRLISGKETLPRFDSLYRVFKKIKNKEILFTRSTLHGCLIALVHQKNQLLIGREAHNIDSQPVALSPEGFWWDNRFLVEPLSIRDLPLTLEKLNKAEILPEVKALLKQIPFYLWETLPVIKQDDVLLAVPSIGYKKETHNHLEINVRWCPARPFSESFWYREASS